MTEQKTDKKTDFTVRDLEIRVNEIVREVIDKSVKDLETVFRLLTLEDLRDQRLTLTEVKSLTHGQIVYSLFYDNADNTPQRYRVNGMVKLWKRDPQRVKVPIKRGLYEYGYITQDNLSEFSLSEDYASHDHEKRDMRSLITLVKSDQYTLKSQVNMIRSHLTQFSRESGHDFIIGNMTETMRERIERLLSLTHKVNDCLESIYQDLRSHETLKTISETVSQDWRETLRVKILEIVSLFDCYRIEISQMTSDMILETLSETQVSQ